MHRQLLYIWLTPRAGQDEEAALLLARITDLALEAAEVALPTLAVPEDHNIGTCLPASLKKRNSATVQIRELQSQSRHSTKPHVNPGVKHAGAEDVFESNGDGDISDDYGVDDAAVTAPRAQIIIIGCWQTVREVGLLLAAIANGIPSDGVGS